MSKITVRINDGEPVEVESVRVYVDGFLSQSDQLEFNFTHEGVARDFWDGEGENKGTDSAEYFEIAKRLYDGPNY